MPRQRAALNAGAQKVVGASLSGYPASNGSDFLVRPRDAPNGGALRAYERRRLRIGTKANLAGWADTRTFCAGSDVFQLPGWGFRSVPNRQRRNASAVRVLETSMAKEAKKLDDLFHDTLKDIYFAEKKILSTLPKMAKAAQNEELKAAFEKHHGETEGQIERLEEVFALIEKKPQGKTCAAIVGITEEGAEIMTEYKGTPALDAGLLAAAQAVEHYEISRYGTLRTWAEELGLDEAATLLQETLDEEEATDEALTEIAKTVVNQEAERV
jgi:ferritin-like metal-binding protein YciE